MIKLFTFLTILVSSNTALAQVSTTEFVSICDRQDSVRVAFENAYEQNCKVLTKNYLENNKTLAHFVVENASSLNPKDFKGLKPGNRTGLYIQNNGSLTTLKPGLFNNLTMVYDGDIYIRNNNSLTTLKSGLFDNLTMDRNGEIYIKCLMC